MERRLFLTELALLSSVAFAKSATKPSARAVQEKWSLLDLESQWDFCVKELDGSAFKDNAQLSLPPLSVCKGMRSQWGAAIELRALQAIAQPEWIYWDANPEKPSDLLIHFFDPASFKKLKTLHRHDLAYLLQHVIDKKSDQGWQHLKQHQVVHTVKKNNVASTFTKQKVTQC